MSRTCRSQKSDKSGRGILGGKRSRKLKIELAPQDRVSALKPYVLRVLMALGRPEALVTDESTMGDMLPVSFVKGKSSKRDRLHFLGWDVSPNDLIVDVAQWLKDSGT
jgi:hypothetical protein